LTKSLTSANFTPDAANGIITFADAVTAILNGNTYINVHTQANLGGEIRGQLTLQ
jgi:CHRD domain-containing protein